MIEPWLIMLLAAQARAKVAAAKRKPAPIAVGQ
jgi:hypothetical protein